MKNKHNKNRDHYLLAGSAEYGAYVQLHQTLITWNIQLGRFVGGQRYHSLTFMYKMY